MITKDRFSLARISLLIKNDLLLNYKQYLLLIAGSAIVLFFYTVNNMSNRWSEAPFEARDYRSLFILAVFFFGIFFGSSFPSFSERNTTRTYLLLPASNLEKLLSQFLLRGILGFIVFFLIFYLTMFFARTTALNMEIVIKNNISIDTFSFLDIFNFEKTIDHILIAVISMFSGVMYLFTIRLFFKRYAAIKAIVAGVAIIFSINLVMILFTHIFFPETNGFNSYIPNYKVIYTLSNMDLFIGWIGLLIGLVSFPLAYYKLKEKQG